VIRLNVGVSADARCFTVVLVANSIYWYAGLKWVAESAIQINSLREVSASPLGSTNLHLMH